MPRLKPSDGPRQRSSRACINCRKRKEKCDGRTPCARCNKRGRECRYSSSAGARTFPAQSSQTHIGGSDAAQSPRVEARPGSSRTRGNLAGATAPQRQNLTGDEQDHDSDEANAKRESSEAPVPRSARLLSDGHGKLIYIGDAASVSFVQNVRRIVLSKLGDCEFTNDALRHSFFEHTSAGAHDLAGVVPLPAQAAFEKPPFQDAEMLLGQYLTATNCLLNLFDQDELCQRLRAWTSDETYKGGYTSLTFYLILAIGAQVINRPGYDSEAIRYYSASRQILSSLDPEEPCIQTIQCYILIGMYLLGACKRNASYMNFGVAVRAAHALGLHRADLYNLFSEDERCSRQRVWRSLRVMDLFLSASLGRPPSTSEFEGVLQSKTTADPSAFLTHEDRKAAALLRLCPIFETILLEIYKRQGVSTKLAVDICRKYRDWASKSDFPDLNSLTDNHNDLAGCLGSVHLLGAYHWSIILLTKPFLIFRISSARDNLRSESERHQAGELGAPSIQAFASSCVESAIRNLDLAEDLLKHWDLPRRLPFVLNGVFNAALVVGAAFFGDYDHHFPLKDGMAKAENYLNHMRISDPQAGRYAQIVAFLKEAASKYIQQRDQMSMEHHSRLKNDLFGNVGPRRNDISTHKDLPTDCRASENPIAARLSELEDALEPRPDVTHVGPETPLEIIKDGTQSDRRIQHGPQDVLTPVGMLIDQLALDQRQTDILSQALSASTRNVDMADYLSSDYVAYDYDIPTFGIFEEFDEDHSRQPDYRNFVIPMAP